MDKLIDYDYIENNIYDRLSDDLTNDLKIRICEFYSDCYSGSRVDEFNLDNLPIEDFKHYTMDEIVKWYRVEIVKACFIYANKDALNNIGNNTLFAILSMYLMEYENTILIQGLYDYNFALLANAFKKRS